MSRLLVDALLLGGARSIASLAPSLTRIESCAAERADARRAVERGYFEPAEDERLRAWFARYLTTRAELHETILDLRPLVRPEETGTPGDEIEFRGFAVSYAAACLLVRSARFLVQEFATHTLVQRKLNEADDASRIPRKQYTAIYKSLTSPVNAWRLREARQYAAILRDRIAALACDPVMTPVVRAIEEAEPALRVGKRTLVKGRLKYRWHAWRRRRASAAQQSMFAILEASGRVVADVRSPWHAPRVTPAHRAALAALLRPGDVIVTRHDRALSNLFLPGYWPHAALHVGPASTRDAMSVAVAEDQASRWIDPLCVLEARKDGVRFRAIDDTLAVDAVAVIRPTLGAGDVATAISNAVAHEGKLYNFDFDFFTSDRLVCTEVVYRAYQGVGGIDFALSHRAGRATLSAEDLLDHALNGRGFEVVAACGVPGTGDALVTEPADAARALTRSYESGSKA